MRNVPTLLSVPPVKFFDPIRNGRRIYKRDIPLIFIYNLLLAFVWSIFIALIVSLLIGSSTFIFGFDHSSWAVGAFKVTLLLMFALYFIEIAQKARAMWQQINRRHNAKESKREN